MGGGGAMSSVSGSRGSFRFCPWAAVAHLSMNSNSISLVTGFEMLLHTAVDKGDNISGKELRPLTPHSSEKPWHVTIGLQVRGFSSDYSLLEH